MKFYDDFFAKHRDETATKVATTANDTYLKTSGDSAGVESYANVSDLLVCWHIQQIVLPSITEEEKPFDPYDESQVDLSGLANAKPTEETTPNG